MTNAVAASLQLIARCTGYRGCNVQRLTNFTYETSRKHPAIGLPFWRVVVAGKTNFVAGRCTFRCSAPSDAPVPSNPT